MHNAIKNCIQHNLYFYTVNSSIRNSAISIHSSLSPTPPVPQKLMHEAFIKLLFIAIDVFNGENTKSFYDFSNSIFYNCRYVILDFQSHSRYPPSPPPDALSTPPRQGLSYMGMCFLEREPTTNRKKRRGNLQHIKYLHAISLNEISGINLKFKHRISGRAVSVLLARLTLSLLNI
jgi:hypothetical protein